MVKGTIGGVEEDTDEAESKMGVLESRRQPIFPRPRGRAGTEYLTDAFGREAVSFIQRQTQRPNPFFLYLPFNACMFPCRPPSVISTASLPSKMRGTASSPL
jgi:hypothetical protein